MDGPLATIFQNSGILRGKKVTCHSQALISFGAQCDQKLLHLQIRINRIENALGLLEKKLGSKSHHLKLLE